MFDNRALAWITNKLHSSDTDARFRKEEDRLISYVRASFEDLLLQLRGRDNVSDLPKSVEDSDLAKVMKKHLNVSPTSFLTNKYKDWLKASDKEKVEQTDSFEAPGSNGELSPGEKVAADELDLTPTAKEHQDEQRQAEANKLEEIPTQATEEVPASKESATRWSLEAWVTTLRL